MGESAASGGASGGVMQGGTSLLQAQNTLESGRRDEQEGKAFGETGKQQERAFELEMIQEETAAKASEGDRKNQMIHSIGARIASAAGRGISLSPAAIEEAMRQESDETISESLGTRAQKSVLKVKGKAARAKGEILEERGKSAKKISRIKAVTGLLEGN